MFMQLCLHSNLITMFSVATTQFVECHCGKGHDVLPPPPADSSLSPLSLTLSFVYPYVHICVWLCLCVGACGAVVVP